MWQESVFVCVYVTNIHIFGKWNDDQMNFIINLLHINSFL